MAESTNLATSNPAWLLILPLYGNDAPSNNNEAVIWLLSLRRTSVQDQHQMISVVTPSATVSVTVSAFALPALRNQEY
ncbi:uncharacterized protein BO88DRAFT_180384 [Aspergillus vadensis CBS 113365]|uniref:Uncharacterized protein n=1 Tax=Aspergillus vadensis (strain CBS 113365 / IMI 142717 / IBT 24658) TaxID=1448311 RepID=A0A319BF60_ASPVC|nr:hypothetical protein BO88DRAFT_180384 [Aspergillus vadensis CBS 113365]PYH64553.1 hypothetical protein BO88DRAFT_180384 [Aspergillus vadensis CBS 113365]